VPCKARQAGWQSGRDTHSCCGRNPLAWRVQWHCCTVPVIMCRERAHLTSLTSHRGLLSSRVAPRRHAPTPCGHRALSAGAPPCTMLISAPVRTYHAAAGAASRMLGRARGKRGDQAPLYWTSQPRHGARWHCRAAIRSHAKDCLRHTLSRATPFTRAACQVYVQPNTCFALWRSYPTCETGASVVKEFGEHPWHCGARHSSCRGTASTSSRQRSPSVSTSLLSLKTLRASQAAEMHLSLLHLSRCFN
jgi:hypothetical protein